jgi:hypothetical protein
MTSEAAERNADFDRLPASATINYAEAISK